MSIINLQSRTPEHVFDIVLNINDGDVSNEYNYKMRKLGEFNYGNDEDVDTILYPANVKIEFTFSASDIPLHFGGGTYGDFRNFEKEYFNLINKFSFLDTSVTINRDGSEYFIGFVDQKNKGGSFEEKTIEITALSDLSKLKDLDPSTFDPGQLYTLPVNPYGNTVSFADVIKETIKKVLPNFGSVFVLSDLKSETNYTFLGQPWHATADYFGDFSSYFWGTDKFATAIDLIRSVCSQFGCVGIVKGNNFYMQSRFAIPSQEALTLKTREFIKNEGPTPYYSQKLEGLQALVYQMGDGSYYEATYGTVTKDGDTVVNRDEVETIVMHACGGDPPGVDGATYPLLVRNIWIRVPGYVAGIGNEQWISSVRNSFYGGVRAVDNQTALWRVVAESIWDQIQYDRLIYQLEMKGTGWQYDKFYKFEYGLTETFRPRKLRYNYPNKSTVMDVIKC